MYILNVEVLSVASDNLYVDPRKKKKAVGKPPHKRRDTRCDAEVKEQEKPKTAHHKGRCTKAVNLIAVRGTVLAFRFKLHVVHVLRLLLGISQAFDLSPASPGKRYTRLHEKVT